MWLSVSTVIIIRLEPPNPNHSALASLVRRRAVEFQHRCRGLGWSAGGEEADRGQEEELRGSEVVDGGEEGVESFFFGGRGDKDLDLAGVGLEKRGERAK